MKIYFDNVNFSSSTGPNSFGTRLAHELSLQGHIIADANDYDVALVFIEKTNRLNRNKPFVHRLDGIWFRPDEFITKNVNIKSTYNLANAVVWQSDFDKEMVTRHWGNQKIGHVIRNGIKLDKATTNSMALLGLHDRYKKVFVCSANWHPQKRLKNNIELFKHIRNTIEPYSCLIVLGNSPDQVVSDMNIYYTGSVSHQVCLEIYSIADWMIHLAYLDHSPNTVVEALSQGCPVICSKDGGTKELVGDYGIMLQEKNDYDFSLLNYDDPPSIDVTQLRNLPEKSLLGKHSDIDISNISRKYVEVFNNVLT